ncbi:ABC transporter ATP-binding protein [Arhodomonas sp. SL1]|uniref:ABC transporter ATP-binding protein n=1 Tax=Arhodomonas sp. SL1 TaxID=3425691 RepID=UPI003F8848BD
MSTSAEKFDQTHADQAFLSCRDMHAYYGESYILQGMSFDVAEGGVMALLGRNGAGKTSTLRTIARAHEPALRQGEIHLAGQALHRCNANQAARAGVQLVPEDRRIIPGITVEENLIVAQVAPPIGWPLEEIYEHFPRLAERRRQDAVTLSGGEQQMLAVARAMAREVKLLLLDEPYEGLAPQIVAEIERIVAHVKALGITTVIVEQNAIAALELADSAVIIDMGEVAYQGSAKEVLDNKELRDEYLAV